MSGYAQLMMDYIQLRDRFNESQQLITNLKQLWFSDADPWETLYAEEYSKYLGVDIPSSPPLSSDDGQEKTPLQITIEACEKEASDRRAMSSTSGMEHGEVSSVYSIRDAKGVAEVASTLRSIARGETAIHGIQPTTEIRIPMRVLFELVYGEGSFSRPQNPVGLYQRPFD